MSNTRVANSLQDVYFGQLATSQASRSNFTPGKASAAAQDENWPKDYRIPTGNTVLETGSGIQAMTRVRTILTDRSIVCDQTLTAVPASPEDTTQVNDGSLERTDGYEYPA